MKKFGETITINGNEIEAPKGEYSRRNAESLLLAGYLRNILTTCETPAKLDLSPEDRKIIEARLSEVEQFIFPALSSLGDIIAAADMEEVDKLSMTNGGYLISTLTELLYLVQQTRKAFDKNIQA